MNCGSFFKKFALSRKKLANELCFGRILATDDISNHSPAINRLSWSTFYIENYISSRTSIYERWVVHLNERKRYYTSKVRVIVSYLRKYDTKKTENQNDANPSRRHPKLMCSQNGGA
jgi:hypothetical protein